jgi:hypothetical protein
VIDATWRGSNNFATHAEQGSGSVAGCSPPGYVAPAQPGNAIHQAGSAHVNLIWFPYKLVSTGIEYMYGARENKDGTEGNASRIQAMVKYKFN